MNVRIFTITNIPGDLAMDWLQHLRDFDIAHPGCHFEVMADTPDMTLAQAVEMVRVNPELTFTRIFERCDHAGWSWEKDGRSCRKCGEIILDPGD